MHPKIWRAASKPNLKLRSRVFVHWSFRDAVSVVSGVRVGVLLSFRSLRGWSGQPRTSRVCSSHRCIVPMRAILWIQFRLPEHYLFNFSLLCTGESNAIFYSNIESVEYSCGFGQQLLWLRYECLRLFFVILKKFLQPAIKQSWAYGMTMPLKPFPSCVYS